MLPVIGVTVSYVLIDMILAVVALVVGFLAALWYVRNVAHSHSSSETPEEILEQESAANDTERVSMAAMQLHDLAMNVATDVSTHNAAIADISENLSEVREAAGDLDATVIDVVAQIQAANQKLQNRLADAENKIKTQAEELRTKQSEARTDALTKLPNRRAFDDAMKTNFESSTDQNRPFSLMILDVDHFKKFNDTHGHQVGDEVLRQVGKTMANVVSNEDLPCRYGGEEFALVLPNTKIQNARTASERVRDAIEKLEIDIEGKKLRVTVSVGVAEISTGETSALLVRRADDAVYAAKEAGRNCGYWNDGENCLAFGEESPVPAAIEAPVEAAKEVPAKAAISAAEDAGEAGNEKVHYKDLPDRAVFSNELQRRINESHRFGVSLSVIHLSVAGYAGLVQEYGDAVGKLLLDTVSNFIRSRLREMDLLGKLDEGSFAVMLPGSSEQEASLVGNRIQSAIATCVIPLGTKQLQLELALGATEVQPDDEVPSMLARASKVASQSVESNAGVC